jgi:glyoxylase-like metal-dependent hydrolase (beta-lactamase superfamily II)
MNMVLSYPRYYVASASFLSEKPESAKIIAVIFDMLFLETEAGYTKLEALTDSIYLIKGQNISSFPPSYSILLGKTTLKPIYTPGHSKDHYCFYEPNEGILFSLPLSTTRTTPANAFSI